MARPPTRPWTWAAIALALAGVAVATLRPARPIPFDGWTWCVLCGDDLTEIVQNVLLFVPLGIALCLADLRSLPALLCGIGVSLSVETTQMLIPGRDPNLGDLVFNTLGTGAGWLTGMVARAAVTTLRYRIHVLVVATATTVLGLTASTALLEPLWYTPPYRVHWQDDADARVLDVSLGALPLREGEVPDGAALRFLLEGGAPLHARVVLGSARRDTWWVRVRDQRGRVLLSLRPDRDDLILSYRSRAGRLKLDQPVPRARGALRGAAPGDTVDVLVLRAGPRRCAVLAGQASCEMGPSVGEGWKVVSYDDRFPWWPARVLDAVWLAILFAPLGTVARRDRPSGLAVAVGLAALYFVPALGGLERSGLHELAGALTGLIVPALLRGRFLAGPRPAAQPRRRSA